MALTLVATPGSAAANSYATVAAADTAASYRIGANALLWVAQADNDKKIQALVMATREIDSMHNQRDGEYIISFPGEPTSDTQALEWPREGDATLPVALVEATIELALSYAPAWSTTYKPDVLNPDATAARVKRKKVDVLETEYFEAGPEATSLERLPGIVQRLLVQLLEYTLIAPGFGSASVTRQS